MRQVLMERIRLWVEDPDSAVEYYEELEGRIAVRMRQQARDATTVWFEVGQRSVTFEAYFMPEPPNRSDVHLQALMRNMGSWRSFFAVDGEGALVLRGRLAKAQVTLEELDFALGEIYQMVEIAFRPMIRAGFGTREKST